MLIIYKTDNIYNKLKEFLKDIKLSDKQIFVFDIHKTTLHKDGSANPEIKKWITKLLKENYNIFFLSYDGQEKRIYENAKLIDKTKLYRKIPKIFMMKRQKHLVLVNLVNLTKIKKATLIDDNPLNIRDVDKLDKNIYNAILYKN